MASILPFRGIHARQEFVEKFTSSASDTDVRDEVKKHRENPYSSIHILNPQMLAWDRGGATEEDYRHAREYLDKLLADGVLKQDEKKALYVYRQVKHNNTFTCLIGLAKTEEYLSDKIKKHELTRAEKEDKITEYFTRVGVNGVPVLLTYKQDAGIDLLILQMVEPAPYLHFTGEDGVEHFLWVAEDEVMLRQAQERFAAVDALYIADGHHRCAALSALYPRAQEFLACYISSGQILIHGFHRLVKDLSGLSPEKFLSALENQGFRIVQEQEKKVVEHPGFVHLYIEGRWHAVEIPAYMKARANPKENLDVYILDRYIFGDILNITDTRTSNRIRYMNGEMRRELLTTPVDKGEAAAAFTLFPLSPEEVMAVSDYGETLPPKSTWIEPKLASGLILHTF